MQGGKGEKNKVKLGGRLLSAVLWVLESTFLIIFVQGVCIKSRKIFMRCRRCHHYTGRSRYRGRLCDF